MFLAKRAFLPLVSLVAIDGRSSGGVGEIARVSPICGDLSVRAPGWKPPVTPAREGALGKILHARFSR